MFRALQCPSSGARQTAVEASGFRMNVEVEVFSVVVGLLAAHKPTTAARWNNLELMQQLWEWAEDKLTGKVANNKV
jgi:hypothetical protein